MSTRLHTYEELGGVMSNLKRECRWDHPNRLTEGRCSLIVHSSCVCKLIFDSHMRPPTRLFVGQRGRRCRVLDSLLLNFNTRLKNDRIYEVSSRTSNS